MLWDAIAFGNGVFLTELCDFQVDFFLNEAL